jgi:hypothetical protein
VSDGRVVFFSSFFLSFVKGFLNNFFFESIVNEKLGSYRKFQVSKPTKNMLDLHEEKKCAWPGTGVRRRVKAILVEFFFRHDYNTLPYLTQWCAEK